MNTSKSLFAIAAFAAVASGAAFAGDVDPSQQYALQFQGSRTRAEVNAEAVAAVAGGNTQPSATPAIQRPQPVLTSGQTRAQVQAEFLADREEATAMTAEDSGAAYLAKLATVRNTNQYFAGTPANAQ
jgi:hypothetical protein